MNIWYTIYYILLKWHSRNFHNAWIEIIFWWIRLDSSDHVCSKNPWDPKIILFTSVQLAVFRHEHEIQVITRFQVNPTARVRIWICLNKVSYVAVYHTAGMIFRLKDLFDKKSYSSKFCFKHCLNSSSFTGPLSTLLNKLSLEIWFYISLVISSILQSLIKWKLFFFSG